VKPSWEKRESKVLREVTPYPMFEVMAGHWQVITRIVPVSGGSNRERDDNDPDQKEE
jgi:hypothetical protein